MERRSNRRRTRIGAVAASAVALMLAGPAAAAPTMTLIWTGTTGSGVTGGSSIDAAPGDTLTLQIVANGDPTLGLSFIGVSLGWDAGLTGQNALECPSPPNFAPGLCTDGGVFNPPFLSPFAPGVTVGPGFAQSFDAGAIPGIPAGGVVTVGRIEFVVGATATTESVDIVYTPALDSVNDNIGGVFFPNATATVMVAPTPLEICEDDLTVCEDDLDSCDAERDALETLVATELGDVDGDGVVNTADDCAGTASMAPVDGDGCSIEQFCGRFPPMNSCVLADFAGDEASSPPRDCGVHDGACVPR